MENVAACPADTGTAITGHGPRLTAHSRPSDDPLTTRLTTGGERMATKVPARDAKRAEQAAATATRERKETERLANQAHEDRVATEEIARDVAAATQESPSSPGPVRRRARAQGRDPPKS